jgi:hypothetical protein
MQEGIVKTIRAMLLVLLLMCASGFCFGGAQSVSGVAATSSGSSNHKLTDKQKDELYEGGTITDSEGNVWRIKTIPGTKKIKKIAQNGWVDAGNIVWDSLKTSKKIVLLLTKKNYYTKNLKGIAEDGIHGMKTGKKAIKTTLKFSESAFTDDFYKGIRNDWRKASRKNSIAINDGSIGWQFQVVKNTLGAGIRTVGRTVYAPLKASIGAIGIAGSTGWTASSAAYTVVAPAVYFVGTPVVAAAAPEAGAIGALSIILTKGSVVPGAMYAWNGSAWVVSKSGKVPTHQTYWITLLSNADDKPHTVMVDRDTFMTIVQAAVLQTLTDAQVVDIHKQISAIAKQQDDIRKQMSALQNRISEKGHEAQQRQNDLANSAAVNETNRLMGKSHNPNVTMKLADDVKALSLDTDVLSQLVRTMAKNQSTELTDVQVAEIVKSIRSKMETLGK